MELKEMIEVLQAAERGEKIEFRSAMRPEWRELRAKGVWNFEDNDYRIAPKEMTLVEELRSWDDPHGIKRRAADRIDELEKILNTPIPTDELLDELKRRMK